MREPRLPGARGLSLVITSLSLSEADKTGSEEASSLYEVEWGSLNDTFKSWPDSPLGLLQIILSVYTTRTALSLP